MLFAARESAVTKNPRLRFTTLRSSSVRPCGSFHSWMSRLMLISFGIQWFSQAYVLLPGPLILEGHQLVDVGLGVDDLLVLDRDAAKRGLRLGRAARRRGGLTAGGR